MEKKSSSTSAKSTDRFIDRFFLRFKNKHDSRSNSITENQMSVPHKLPSGSEPREDEFFNDFQYEWQYRKISLEDLGPFCEQLGKFVNYVHGIQDLVHLTYQYPNALQTQLNTHANELECLYKEVKSSLETIQRTKQQIRAVRKEKASVKRIWKKIQDEETREMENLIAMYDKPMYTRWENIKNTQKPETLELLMHDIKLKQQALDYLNTLASRKLGQLQVFVPLHQLDDSLKERNTPIEDKPTSSALPNRRLRHGSMNEFRASFRRRRASDKQEVKPVPPSQTTELPLVPFTFPPRPFQVLASTVTQVDSVTAANNATGSSTNLPSLNTSTIFATSSSSSRSNSDTMGSEFQTEMRSVLQALFGEIRTRGQTRPSTASTSVTVNLEPPDLIDHMSENRSTDIELYSLTDTPPTSK